MTYGICGCEFLLRGHDGARALSSVQGTFTTNDSLFLCGATLRGFASDFGHGVPVVHDDVFADVGSVNELKICDAVTGEYLTACSFVSCGGRIWALRTVKVEGLVEL